jgi:hypothetical protein
MVTPNDTMLDFTRFWVDAFVALVTVSYSVFVVNVTLQDCIELMSAQLTLCLKLMLKRGKVSSAGPLERSSSRRMQLAYSVMLV